VTEEKILLASGELTYFRAGSGSALLYLHPAGGVRRSAVLAGLADSFSLHVPVIPGFEGTEFHPGVQTRQALAALVAEFVDRVIGSRCDVMGWSFGGAVALWLALERPDLVDRLVLECPAGLVSIDKRIKRVNRALLEH
jgi:pimeloyl-ACP methyl ester carboxylesterase